MLSKIWRIISGLKNKNLRSSINKKIVFTLNVALKPQQPILFPKQCYRTTRQHHHYTLQKQPLKEPECTVGERIAADTQAEIRQIDENAMKKRTRHYSL